MRRTRRGLVVKQIARREPTNLEDARRITLKQLLQKTFNPEYHQVLLRVSDATKGLFWGAPPGGVK
jgi:hypothetical protein